jgi:acylaminoacyl-peptidase
MLACWASASLALTVDTKFISKITIDASNTKVSMASNQFSQVVEQNLVDTISGKIDHSKPISIFNEQKRWRALRGDASGEHLLRFSISASQFAKGKLVVDGAETASLYLNKESVNKNIVDDSSEFAITLLNQDYRVLLMVSGIKRWQDFSVQWLDEAESTQVSAVEFGNDKANKRASMKHYYDSETVSSLNISPDGELLVWSKRTYSDLNGDKPESVVEIIDIDTQNVVYRWQAMTPSHITWSTNSEALVFVHENGLYKLQRKNWQLQALASDVEGIRGLEWLSDSELLISWHKPEEKPHAFTKRYRA